MQFHLKVKPGSKVDALFYDEAGLLNVKIKAPARDGKANTYLTAFLAKQFGIPKSGVTILSGFTSPHKRLDIEAGESEIREILDSLKK